jgi:hypothetical protein
MLDEGALCMPAVFLDPETAALSRAYGKVASKQQQQHVGCYSLPTSPVRNVSKLYNHQCWPPHRSLYLHERASKTCINTCVLITAAYAYLTTVCQPLLSAALRLVAALLCVEQLENRLKAGGTFLQSRLGRSQPCSPAAAACNHTAQLDQQARCQAAMACPGTAPGTRRQEIQAALNQSDAWRQLDQGD